MVGATDRHDGRAVALADFGGRGALDVVVANQRGPLLLYRNEVPPDRQWIAFDLEGGCRERRGGRRPCSNRSAIGAQVEVFWNGRQQVQEVSGGSGFCAQNQRRLHFGLGAQRVGRSRRDPLAVGQDAGAEGAAGRARPPDPGAGMTTVRARSRAGDPASAGCSASTSATSRRSWSRSCCSSAS